MVASLDKRCEELVFLGNQAESSVGSVLDFWEVFWILGCVLDSGKCFWIVGSVLDCGKCFGLWEEF